MVYSSGCLGMMSYGQFFGWPSPSLPLLLQPGNPVHVTSQEGTWVTSCQALGAIFGAILCTYIINIIGRKWTVLLTAVPAITGWLLIAFASSVWELYVGRFICGISSGSGYVSVVMYMGEISPARIRGILTSALTVAVKIGLLIEWIIGPFLSTRNLALVSMSLPIVFVLSIVWLPESPYHLMRRGKHQEAIQTLARIRGTMNVSVEAENMEKSVKIDLENDTGLRELLTVSGNRKALTVVVCLAVIQQWSGSMAIISYAELTFTATGNNFEGKYITMMLGAVQVVSAMFSTVVVDSFGRRTLLIFSTFGTSMSTMLVGLFFYLQHRQMDVDSIVWLPAIGTLSYIITYAVGLAGIPFTMISEVFPTNVKALGSTIGIMCCNLFGFFVTVCFPSIVEAFGRYASFWLFSGITLMGMVFVYCYVPETRGKTLQEVQDQLHGRKLF
ncbi:Facilitated trehalose transporter Tret1 [Dufourea novaeangliae]|uniref:Facilitated trehalose transporter Tret1 n=1 Tax=Dufourea novaeangliae TaxID=178035 RepID=A0A154P8P5_DUFNO|nr:Facilitated trehalose transporter Tret1 [Dufourea novaeangliae]